eukprot:scaffold933_cov56-Phaeocystis_antarctica.AAC.4
MPIDTPILTVPILPLARSLARNRLGDEGASALAAILNGTSITNLKCAAAPKRFTFVSAPIDSATPHLCSLARNQLCGLDTSGRGTYTAEGITKLCEGLKGSAVTSLKCAAPPSLRLSVNAR